jgi:hypothetical protein
MTHSSNARLNDNRLDVTGPQQREQDEDHAIRSVGDDATTLEALEADNLPLALTEKLVTSGGSGGNNDDDYDRNVSPAPDANPQQQATSSTGAGAQQTRSNGGLPPHSLRVSFQRQASSSSSSSHHSPATTKSPGYDTQLLHRAVADAGRWAYGIVWVEVWALSADQTHLYRPECGWWIDPRFHHSRCGAKCPVCRLTDPSRLDYVAPQRLSPGQGLPGVLWSEVSSGKAGAANLSWSRSFRETLASRILGTHHHHPIAAHCAAPTEASSSPPPLPPPPPSHPVQVHLGFHLARLHHQLSSRIVWRDVNQIESDPDQPWNPRLRALAGAGLGWVGAVPFHLRQDRRGLVLYLAPNKVDLDRLRSEANESYLLSAGDLIGAAYALRGPRQRLVGERRLELKEALRRVRKKILEIHRNGRTLQEYVEERAAAAQTSTLQKPQAAARHGQDRLPSSPSSPPPSSCADPNSRLASAVKGVGRSASSAVKKTLWGAGPPTIPPAFSWKQTALTFAGSLVTLLAVTTMSDRFVNFWGTEYGIVLGYVRVFAAVVGCKGSAYPSLDPCPHPSIAVLIRMHNSTGLSVRS